MADYAAESGHWYRPDGTPAYTIVGKNGKERATTLRDAREHGLLPSVTGIIRLAAAPGLEKWKRQQVLLAALTLPRLDDENEPDWLKRVEQDWQEQSRKAAGKGERIHGGIERHYRGMLPDEDIWPHVCSAKNEIDGYCGAQEWNAERSFAHERGYGGKTDLFCRDWVLDIKTKDTLDDLALFDEHLMQLAANRRGQGVDNAQCGILFVTRGEEPKACFVRAKESDLERGLFMFDALLDYWYAKTGCPR